ncbi:MAG: type II secretion system protein GspN [Bdellovibrionales bacterium]|nr:type II secretion system protein GspN [Bdellovibrionales bacterium]
MSPAGQEAFTGAEGTQEIQAPGRLARLRKYSAWGFWAAVFVVCLILFTVMKFPEARIKALIQGQINSALAPQGVSVIAQEASLSIWRGLRYEMGDVSLRFAKTGKTVRLDRLLVKPSMLGLISGTIAGSAYAERGDSELGLDFAVKGTQADLSVDLEDVDLGKLGLVEAMAGVPVAGLLNGFAELEGDLNNPQSWEASAELKAAHVKISEQRVLAFKIPEIGIAASEIRLKATKGKLELRQVRLGDPKRKPADDLTATLTGDVNLQRNLMASGLKVNARFSLSQKVLGALPLIDAFLGPGKQADGTYAFDLSGSLGSPVPVAVKR